jgi:hypothetical protein
MMVRLLAHVGDFYGAVSIHGPCGGSIKYPSSVKQSFL